MDKPIRGFHPDAVQQLTGYDWPGNARQLRNVIERAVIQCETEAITPRDLSLGTQDNDLTNLMEHVPETNEELKTLKKEIRQKAVSKIEKNFILNALAQTDWNVTKAARKVGLKRTNFQTMMRKYDIIRPQKA